MAIWPFDFSLIDQCEKFSFHILIYANIVGSVSNVGTFSGENPWSVENKKHVVSVKERFSAMTLSTKSSWHDVTLNDAVKNHIRASHLYPRKQGKSCFLLVSEITVWKMVEETFLYPDISTPHRSDENKIVLRKKFQSPVGIHGRNGALCFSVIVIYDWLDRRIITAFPTTWRFKTFVLSLRREIQISERFVVAELRAERADWVLSQFSV